MVDSCRSGYAAPEQDVGEGVADGGAQLGEQEDVPHVRQGAQVDDAADVEDQEELQRSFRARMSRISASVRSTSPRSGRRSLPSPETRPST